MTVEKTLRLSLLKYPSIHLNKWDVYHHWFCVNGNGYEWKDGELVIQVEDDNYTQEMSIEEAIKFQFNRYLSSSCLNRNVLRKLEKNILMILNIEARMKDFTLWLEIYPLCEYSKIVQIPKDIKPDWLMAAKEFYAYLLDNYINLSDKDRDYVDKIAIK
jgi:hypothetical protein